MTTIAALHADKVRIPFRRPFLTAAGMWLERDAWIVRLVDADGRTGLGEAVLEPADGETAALVLDQLVREAAVLASAGSLPSRGELERHGAAGRALGAAIDSALFDIERSPQARIRAGGDGVGVNATLPSVGPAASAEAALQALEAGFGTLKLKVGAERETEALVERVRAVRSAVGPEVRLRLDVNGAWDVATAVDRLSAVRRFDIEYAEQPVAPGDAAALAEVRRRGRVPVAADEAVVSIGAARELLGAGAADVLVVKLARVGGPAAAGEIADAAGAAGIPIVLSTLFETGVGIAAGLAAAAALPELPVLGSEQPPDHGLATAGLLEDDLLGEALVVEHGRMWLPEPMTGASIGGLGVRLDLSALDRHRFESASVEHR